MVTDFLVLIATKSFILKAWSSRIERRKDKEELIWSVSNEGMMSMFTETALSMDPRPRSGQGRFLEYARTVQLRADPHSGIPGLVQCPVVPILIVLILF